MLGLSSGWRLDVERGPDLLFIGVQPAEGGESPDASLAESVWTLLTQQFTYSVVLELDRLGKLSSALIGDLLRLKKRVQQRGGLMRVCGLSEENRKSLARCGVEASFPNFQRREDALMGRDGRRPR